MLRALLAPRVLIRRSRWPTWLRVTVIALGVWAVALLTALLYSLPDLTRTSREWVAFALLAPPLVMLCEWIVARLLGVV